MIAITIQQQLQELLKNDKGQDKKYFSKPFPNHIAPTSEQKTFLNDKKMPSELYIYMVVASELKERNGEMVSFCPKKLANPTIIAIFYSCSRQTASNKIKYLKEAKMIEYDEQLKGYWIPKPETYLLIPIEVAMELTQYFTQPVMRVYIYLVTQFKWKRKKQQKFNFTEKNLIDNCGFIIKPGHGEYKMAKQILAILSNCGLITYEQITLVSSSGHIYKHFQITDYSNTIKDTTALIPIRTIKQNENPELYEKEKDNEIDIDEIF